MVRRVRMTGMARITFEVRPPAAAAGVTAP